MERGHVLVEPTNAHDAATSDATTNDARTDPTTTDAASDADLSTRLRQAYVAHALAGLLPARRNAFAKRALDLTLGLLLLAVALPLLGALALAIRVGWLGRAVGGHDGARDTAPVFLCQQYAGRGGRVFVGASLVALRTTWLRRLARLPLLLAVVRGEMSLVGPRPMLYDEWIAQADADTLPARHALAVLYAKPGLTGPWIVHKGSALAIDGDAVPGATPDLFSIAHGSFTSDLAILARTPLALLRRRAY